MSHQAQATRRCVPRGSAGWWRVTGARRDLESVAFCLVLLTWRRIARAVRVNAMGRYFCSTCEAHLDYDRFPTCSGCGEDFCEDWKSFRSASAAAKAAVTLVSAAPASLMSTHLRGLAAGWLPASSLCVRTVWRAVSGTRRWARKRTTLLTSWRMPIRARRVRLRDTAVAAAARAVKPRAHASRSCARNAQKAARQASAAAEAAGLPHDLPLARELLKTAKCPSLRIVLGTWLAKRQKAQPAVAPAPSVVAKAPGAEKVAGGVGAPSRKRSSH